MKMATSSIGALGPAGTFSELAVNLYDSSLTPMFFGSINEAIDAVFVGDVQEAILPVENSIQGTILETLDGIFYGNLKIIGETIFDVRQSIVGLQSTLASNDVKCIYSHPQAIAQCRNYIKRHYPKAKIIFTPSTASAFKKIHDEGLAEALAIGPEFSAKRYSLEILNRDIQDTNNNQTLFVIISKHIKKENTLTNTMLVIDPEGDRPGLLHDILGVFKESNINLDKIESRPSHKKLGSYIFYLKVALSPTDERVRDITHDLEIYGKVTNLSA